MPRAAVLVPCYKRPEYTKYCIEALEKSQDYSGVDFYLVDDGSHDDTYSILSNAKLSSTIIRNSETQGLRTVIVDFFELVRGKGYDYFLKMDNDCIVPKDWLTNLTSILRDSDFDIVSPNVLPSNAAFVLGKDGIPIRPSETVGGLWCMKSHLIDDVSFEKYAPNGIHGAFNILKQIIIEKEAKCGWVPMVEVQDVGHWSGEHPQHIKSKEHEEYSMIIGRPISWSA